MATKNPQNSKSSVMDQLLAGAFTRPKNFNRGDSVEGHVISITDSEVIIDLDTKSEGVLNKKDISEDKLSGLKVGDKLQAYVLTPENESGQITLSMQKVSAKTSLRSEAQIKRWQKFIQAQDRKSTLTGKVTEANKGGLVVEIDHMRGFLPSSQLSISVFAEKHITKVEDLIGQDLPVSVIEVNPENNRLILVSKRHISEEDASKLDNIQVGQKVKGKIAIVTPLCLLLDMKGLEGVVYAQEAAWQDTEDLRLMFESGQEVESVVTGKDDTLGRLVLSIKQTTVNPMAELLEKYQPDDIVKGTVAKITPSGVVITLEDGVEGFILSSKVETGIVYTIGDHVSVMVDSIDKEKQKLYLAPFITSTKDLIYR